jgi:glutamine amidotransferase/cyclase
VVVSIDPKRVYCHSPEITLSPSSTPLPPSIPSSLLHKTVVPLLNGQLGPSGEAYCWWQVTVKGGRETRDMDAVQLAKVPNNHGIRLYCIIVNKY